MIHAGSCGAGRAGDRLAMTIGIEHTYAWRWRFVPGCRGDLQTGCNGCFIHMLLDFVMHVVVEDAADQPGE